MRLSVRSLPFAAAALVGCITLLIACGETTEPAGSTVAVRDDNFNPSTQTVAVGETVTWQWTGNNQHNVTWVNPSGTSNSPTQSAGTYTRNFSAAGTNDYFCTIHGTATSGMRGTVVVQ
ncbi:MAG TPA: plastocyanin/azurin family copper-binding protein [Gemmatimonadales bacterium]